jgi:hypothetical protein
VAPYPFDEVLDTDEGWAKENRHYWRRDWRGYLEWFFSQCFTEPHSTKQIEVRLRSSRRLRTVSTSRTAPGAPAEPVRLPAGRHEPRMLPGPLA